MTLDKKILLAKNMFIFTYSTISNFISKSTNSNIQTYGIGYISIII